MLKHLKDRRVRVPEDVQLIGFDGTRQFFTEDYFCSTIVQPVRQMAATAVDILLSEDRPHTPALICLPGTYAPGGTTQEAVTTATGDMEWQASI